jgi:hypothetical protein
MTTGQTTPLDDCRDGWEAALRALSGAQEWRRDWHALIGRGIERDRDALRQVGDALEQAADGRALTDACQRAWQDYLRTSASLWQEAGALNARAQHASVAWSRDWLHGCQGDWFKHWQHSFDAQRASMPWRDWAAAFGAPPSAPPAAAQANGTGAQAHSS